MSSQNIQRRNLFRELSWYLMLAGATGAVAFMAQNRYQALGEPQSLSDFIVNLVIAGAALMLLSFVWWRVSTVRGTFLLTLRDSMEQYAFRWSLCFCLLAFALTLYFYLRCHMIVGSNGHSHYASDCVFMLPAVFVLMMYLLPPQQVSAVILPGGRIGCAIFRFFVSFLASAGAAVSFAINFIL